MQALFDALTEDPPRAPEIARRIEEEPSLHASDEGLFYDPHREAVLAVCAPYFAKRVGTITTTQPQLWHVFCQDPTPFVFHQLRFSWQQAIETLLLYWGQLRGKFPDTRERHRAFHKLLGVLRELDLDIAFPLDPAWSEGELIPWKRQLRFPAHAMSTLDVDLFLRWATYASVHEFWSAMEHCRASPQHRVAIIGAYPASRLLGVFVSVTGKRFDRLQTIEEKMAFFDRVCVKGKVDFDTWIRIMSRRSAPTIVW